MVREKAIEGADFTELVMEYSEERGLINPKEIWDIFSFDMVYPLKPWHLTL